MAESILCLGCGQEYRVIEAYAGRNVKCTCGARFQMPRIAEGALSAQAVLATPGPSTAALGPMPPVAPRTVTPRTVAPPTPKPTALDPARAEQIVREVATRLKAKAVLKSLGNFKPKVIETIRQRYAFDMIATERPLALLDISFLQDGKAGLLVTNGAIYSSHAKRSFPLNSIVSVAVEVPTQLQMFLAAMLGVLWLLFAGRLKSRVVVNGHVVHEGVIGQPKFWQEVLEQLGAAAREASGGLNPAGSGTANHGGELVRMAAVAVCSNMSRERIVEELARQGYERARATVVVSDLFTLHRTPRRHALPVILILIGSVLAGMGLIVTVATEGGFIWYGPVIFGIGMAGIGIQRLISGPPPMKTEELIAAYPHRE